MQRALESALAELTLGRHELVVTDRSAVEAFLLRHGVSSEDAAELQNGGLERLLVYRKLVRGNFRHALNATIPRTIARLGDVFSEYFDAFLAERPPRSRYLRELTPDFLDFCLSRFASDPQIPAYVGDLARHEALQVEVASLQAPARQDAVPELALDAPLEFIQAHRLVHYDYAVHRLSADPSDRTVPETTPVALFVYRSPEHEVRYLELTPLANAILRKLISEQKNLGAAITEACQSQNVVLDESVLTGTSALLSDLAERGALLGRKAPLSLAREKP